MKKTFLALALFAAGLSVSNAQISSGGLPLSMLSNETVVATQSITAISYKAPLLDQVKEEDARASLANPKPYRAGILVQTDFSFPQSGNIVTLADGRKIWRGKLQITNAPALVLYYDQFKLPAGVKLYLTNANGKQVLGAFTAENNAESGTFATQEVQGDIVNLEIDMEAAANPNDVKLHINKAAYMYRSINNLSQFAGNEDNGTSAKPTEDQFAGSSSTCEINAICPQGSAYASQRKATARILMIMDHGYVGFCTGTLINNTKGDCTPYILTATHCEETNSKADSTYENFLFYFNFETPDCAGTQVAPNSKVLFGAKFVARANFNTNVSGIIGDFLLLKLSSKVPASYGAFFAGWNRATTNATGNTYIGFHHPAGDEKKLATGTILASNGTFNQDAVANTHWYIQYASGGVEGGSSGSALFDQNGRIIGDLSGGPDIQACSNYFNINGDSAIMSQYALYSKFSRNWEYPEGNGVANAQLKPWLDPTNTNVTTLDALGAAASCNSPVTPTSISDIDKTLGNAISIYPNPVIGSNVRMKINLDKKANLNITFYDITGARKGNYELKQIISGEYTFDLSGYSNGTYLMRISDGSAITSKKIVIEH